MKLQCQKITERHFIFKTGNFRVSRILSFLKFYSNMVKKVSVSYCPSSHWLHYDVNQNTDGLCRVLVRSPGVYSAGFVDYKKGQPCVSLT